MAYNAEKTIGRAIQSVLNQTEKSVALCIRNNGSTDRTGEIVRGYAASDGRVYFTENKVNGITDDNIRPFERGWWPFAPDIEGEYISFIDADDALAENFVEIMYRSARENDSQIVACGCYFTDSSMNKVLGKRLPPDISDFNAADKNMLTGAFPAIYNCFRTWWGKLYRADFFFDHYDAAWGYPQPLWWTLDTCIVLGYLSECTHLTCVGLPLYFFRNNDQSFYNNRPMDGSRLLEASVIFQLAMKWLQKNFIASDQNIEFLYNIHFAYCIESMAIYLKNKDIPSNEKLKWISEVLNDKICSYYADRHFNNIMQKLEPFIGPIREDGENNPLVYTSFLMRLDYFLHMMTTARDNVLNFVILFGCLCDAKNRNTFGKLLLRLNFPNMSKGEEKARTFHDQIWEWWFYHPMDLVNLCNSMDCDVDVEEVKAKLTECWEMEDYQAVCDLISLISQKCPFDREALIYRILMSVLIDEMDLAVILVSTAKAIWNEDKEINQLYTDITEQV